MPSTSNPHFELLIEAITFEMWICTGVVLGSDGRRPGSVCPRNNTFSNGPGRGRPLAHLFRNTSTGKSTGRIFSPCRCMVPILRAG
jgi:hypothetical protein